MGKIGIGKIVTEEPILSLTQRKDSLLTKNNQLKSQLKKWKASDWNQTIKGVYLE